MRSSLFAAFVSASLLFACGAPVGPADGGFGGGAGGGSVGGGGSGGGAGGGSGGGSSTANVPQEYCALMLAEQCGVANTQQNLDLCKNKLTTASSRGCGDLLGNGYACLKPFGSNGLECYTAGGFTDVTTSVQGQSCEEQFHAGMACAGAVTNQNCYSVSCQYNQDCPSGWSCNNKTNKCFNTSASCLGLPCTYNQDCGTGATCNNALGQCVKS